MAKSKQLCAPRADKLDRWFRILQIILFCMPFAMQLWEIN